MKRKIVGDMFLNIVAAMVPIGVVQFLIQPILAVELGSEEYGLLLAMTSLLSLVPSMFGNVLNNIRLLYQDKNPAEDFSLLFWITEVISAIIIIGGCIYYDNDISVKKVIFMLILSVLWLAREYFIVAFRVVINYKAILINNFMLAIGYFIGFLIFKLTHEWQYIYILGYVVALVYIMFTTNIWKEKAVRTPSFCSIAKQAIILSIATFLPRIVTFADKLLIYPLLGGDTVSIYYVATILGNAISLVVTPIANVILSYLVKEEKENNTIFAKVLGVGFGVCIIGYVGCLIISRPVLYILYPQYVEAALKFVPLTTGAAVISSYVTLLIPFLMRYKNLKWQIVINALTVVVYICSGVFLLKNVGLYGFCIGVLITNVFKFLVCLIIYKKERR